MHPIIEILLFIASGGIILNDKLRHNKIAVAGAAGIAIISFVLLIQSFGNYFIGQYGNSTISETTTNDYAYNETEVVASDEMTNGENITEADIQNDSQLDTYLQPLWNRIG